MEADEWLQLLAQHPIFGEPATKTKSGTLMPTVRERVAVRGTDLFIAVGREVRWINLKACKDAYVRFESKRTKLRSTDTSRADSSADTKQEAVAAVPWYRLGCEALTFDIERLAVNASGKLLAAVGLHQVAVVVLPTPRAMSKSVRGGAFTAARLETVGEEQNDKSIWVDCRSMLLGTAPRAGTPKSKHESRRHSAGFGAGMSVAANWSVRTRVVDVLWHPLSTNDTHLLVLQANGTIKIFDVSEDADSPEQTLSLFSASGAGSAGFAMSRAVSFCMGSSTSAGWSRVTLYVLTNTAELYSLCPVLPRRCSLDQTWLEDLLEAVELDVREWQAEEYETSECIYTPPELIAARAAVKWLDQILGLDNGKFSERMYLTLPNSLLLPAAAQGPYLFQPEPAPVSAAGYGSDSSESDDGVDSSNRGVDFDPDDACSVLYMESASGMGIGLVAIAYCDARVEVFADLEPVIGAWVDTSVHSTHIRDLPVLVTLASVDLTVKALASCESAKDNRQIGSVALLADTLSPTVFYALHSHGVHRVDMRSWTRQLERAIGLTSESGRSAALEQLLNSLDGRREATADSDGRGSLARSCVQCIIHTNPSASRPAIPVVGAAVVDDIYLSYSLVALIEPSQLIGVSLPLSTDSATDSAADKADNESTTAATADDSSEPNRRRLDLSTGTSDVVYVPRLPSSEYQVPASLADGSASLQQPRLVLRDESRGESGVSEERLKLLGSVVSQLRGQLSTVANAHAEMRERLDLQVQEHQRQHDKLSAISSGFVQQIGQMRRSQQRLDALRENGQKLSLRVDQVLRQLISHYQPELTAAEREFSREVRSMDMSINGFDGYNQLINQLQDRVNDMRVLSKLLNARASTEARRANAGQGAGMQPQLSKPALAKLEQMLEDEQLRIRETCERIQDISERVDSVGDLA
ncbi:hypothetical protein IWW36_000071 [Coemansia brasiliensis]|uniref:Uncharacterized protein n=1 Tax=Coemansia brasiliensis TaxID=2650707 RepID=A0A9W8IE78_9FUNG|nr:hypothetical protein IWW36_000071 [Coemansia brasiliensis]